jgi:hypothetical protein
VFIGNLESILGEPRKYALVLNLVAQGIQVLAEEAAHAIFTNCATVIAVRVSGADALRLAREFGPDIPPVNLQDLPDYTFYSPGKMTLR